MGVVAWSSLILPEGSAVVDTKLMAIPLLPNRPARPTRCIYLVQRLRFSFGVHIDCVQGYLVHCLQWYLAHKKTPTPL